MVKEDLKHFKELVESEGVRMGTGRTTGTTTYDAEPYRPDSTRESGVDIQSDINRPGGLY